MTEIDELVRVRSNCINDASARALADLGVDAIDSSQMGATIGRLKFAGAPSYLPIATIDGEVIAIHLLPARDVKRSPIVCFASGSRSPDFMCADLRTFPRALWIWLAAYYKSRVAELRSAIESLVREIDGAAPIPDRLWTLLDEAPPGQPQRWNYRAKEPTVEAWRIADVGHPFLELSDLPREDPRDALAELTHFLETHSDPAPQVRSALIDALREAGEAPPQDASLDVLCAEAWLGGAAAFRTSWATVEPGLGEWSKALQAATHLPGLLDQTPFRILIDHPQAYSGADLLGPALLESVAEAFSGDDDLSTALNQFRNAAFVALDAQGGYGRGLCDRIAETCDKLEIGSLAATLARTAGMIGMKDV